MPNVSTDAYGAAYWQYVNGLSGGANNFSANLREQIRKRRYLTRFVDSYSLAPSVDCWVHTGDFGGSLRACLQLFEAQGGRVDWHAPALAKVLAASDDAVAGHARAPPAAPPPPPSTSASANKNIPGGSQLAHHQPCRFYFPDDLKREIEVTYEPFYRAFRWPGCCEGSSQMLVGWSSNGSARVVRA